MRTLYFMLYKEFRQIFRNKALLPIIFVAPILQLLVLAYAADFEIKNLDLYLVDQDHSAVSRTIYQRVEASPYFTVVGYSDDLQQARAGMERDEVDLSLEIPAGFGRALYGEEPLSLHLEANAIDGVKAGLGVSYVQQLIRQVQQELIMEDGLKMGLIQLQGPPVSLQPRYWFNPLLDYKTFMVPGILALLITMIGGFLSAMNIVREKELGTIEQLNVSPMQKYHFILGKLIPFWIIALFELGFGLALAKFLYDLPFVGSPLLLMGFAGLYLIIILGLGLFISTITDTQQQAMFIAWFFMVVFIFLSGLFTAIENMPLWAQQLTWVNPIRYFIEVIRGIMLRGADFHDLRLHALIMTVYAVLINGLALWRYRKTA